MQNQATIKEADDVMIWEAIDAKPRRVVRTTLPKRVVRTTEQKCKAYL